MGPENKLVEVDCGWRMSECKPCNHIPKESFKSPTVTKQGCR